MHKRELILYWSNEDRSFIAEVPALAECMACGESQATALCNLYGAMQIWIDTARELGDPVPVPKDERLRFA